MSFSPILPMPHWSGHWSPLGSCREWAAQVATVIATLRIDNMGSSLSMVPAPARQYSEAKCERVKFAASCGPGYVYALRH